MSSFKKLTYKVTSRQVFVRVYRLDIQSVMLVYFRPSFLNCCPSDLLSGSNLPPPPSPFLVSNYSKYVQTVCGLEVVLVLSPVGVHILQEFNTLYLTIFRTYKIARPSQTKTKEGRGPQTDKHPAKSRFTDQFF
jgi:hypothetical protein